MREHLTARNGWIGLAAGVTAFELLCPQGETLSEGVDRALERPLGKILAMGGVAITAAHLLNLFEAAGVPQLDPFSRVLRWKDDQDTSI